MHRTRLNVIVRHADRLLQASEFADWEGAVNGLQVENAGWVRRVAAAVDGTQATVDAAIAGGADLLVVHHGLFWSKTYPWTGPRRRLIQTLIEGDLAVYSSHLPLDAHPKLGNNARLAAALGLKRPRAFFSLKGRPIGFRFAARLGRAELARRLRRVLGRDAVLLPGGPEICRRIGIVTGGAGAELAQAAAEGVDTFITGEGPHWTFAKAEELGLNVFYGGHYATETFGVKALGASIAKRFKLSWFFIDRPTGL